MGVRKRLTSSVHTNFEETQDAERRCLRQRCDPKWRRMKWYDHVLSRFPSSPKFKYIITHSKPCLMIFLPIIVASILISIFQYLPSPTDSQEMQTASQLFRDLITLPLHKSISKIANVKIYIQATSHLWLFLSQYVSQRLNICRQLTWHVNNPPDIIDNRLPSISKLDVDVLQVMPAMHKLVNRRYFKIFKIDLNAKCPLYIRNSICTSPDSACSVCECEDDHIPPTWKENPIESFVAEKYVSGWGGHLDSQSLDNLEIPSQMDSSGFRGKMLFDSVSDEHLKTASYVDLRTNEPKNTGYVRTPIWSYIYNENCIGGPSPTNPFTVQRQDETVLPDAECVEEYSFYRILSSLQSLISVSVAENFYTYPTDTFKYYLSTSFAINDRMTHFRPDTVLLSPVPSYNVDFFMKSVGNDSDRLSSIYFSFSLLLRTVCHAEVILQQCHCNTGLPVEDEETRKALNELIVIARKSNSCDSTYMKQPIFKRKASLALRQFRNITRIMDCVECESCRLHAKVKVLALYLGLKATSEPFLLNSIERNELVALMNALHYYGEAILAVKRFRIRITVIRYFLITAVIAATALVVSTAYAGLKYAKSKKRLK